MPAIHVTVIKNALATWIRAASGLPADRIRWAGQNAPEPEASTLPWILIGRLSFGPSVGTDWTTYEPRPLTFEPKPLVLDPVTGTGTSAAHTLATRDGPVRIETDGSLAGTGLDEGVDYWTVVLDDDTLQLASSFLDAHAGTTVPITGAGVGTHTIVATAATRKAGQELTEYVRGPRRITFSVQCFPPAPAEPGDQIADDMDPVAVLSDVSAKARLRAFAAALKAAGIGVLDSGTPQPIDGVMNAVYFEPRASMTVTITVASEVEGTETLLEHLGVEDEETGTSWDIALDTPE